MDSRAQGPILRAHGFDLGFEALGPKTILYRALGLFSASGRGHREAHDLVISLEEGGSQAAMKIKNAKKKTTNPILSC